MRSWTNREPDEHDDRRPESLAEYPENIMIISLVMTAFLPGILGYFGGGMFIKDVMTLAGVVVAIVFGWL